MRLIDLEPKFLTLTSEEGACRLHDDLATAQGIEFLCPKCFVENGNSSVGTHSVMCWFRDRGVSDVISPGPGRWTPEGTGYEDLSFVPGNPPMACSVLLTAGCGWHGFVRNGEVTLS